MDLTLDNITELQSSLKSLTKVNHSSKRFTTLSALEYCYRDILRLRKQGYSYEEIAEHLTKSGLKIASSTLKRYMTEIGNKKAQMNEKRKNKRQGSEPSSTTTQISQSPVVGQQNQIKAVNSNESLPSNQDPINAPIAKKPFVNPNKPFVRPDTPLNEL